MKQNKVYAVSAALGGTEKMEMEQNEAYEVPETLSGTEIGHNKWQIPIASRNQVIKCMH